LIACGLIYAGVYIAIIQHAYQFIEQPKLPMVSNPAIVVLGNRAKVKGTPNVCMTGRVDIALDLLAQYSGNVLVLSGGEDPVEQSYESQIMATHALKKGFSGRLIQENKSTTTFENLKYSTLLLQENGVKTVIVVSEPHHLWRASLLAHAQGMHQMFDLYFVAAKTECWNMQGIFSTGAVREPLAWIKNFMQGHY
jgi:uncharacterized SAM-binding protein YcdF (DUF218 family)